MAYKKNTTSEYLDSKGLSDLIKNDNGDLKLILIFGEEDFFIEKEMEIIKKKYLSEGAEQMDYVKFDMAGKEPDIEKIRENLELPSWLSSKRIVVVADFSIPSDTDEFVSLLASVPNGSLLVFTASKVDKRKKSVMTAFSKNGVIAELNYLEDEKSVKWISHVLSKSSITIDEEAATSIVSRCDKSMRLISSETNKILLYCTGTNTGHVDIGLVEQICPPDIGGSVFNITDAVGQKDARTALDILNNLLMMKEPTQRIRFMLMRHLKHLICAKELGNQSEIASRLKVQPFVAKKLVSQSSRFNMDALIMLFNECSREDSEIKHGNLDDRKSLESFIVMACGR
ncbi:MAG: DNA polymerase III subunit delta [Saccharofermentans sp.]|nr:DNA polymerase III subunit delta [Saccharofermentans sp.]